MITNIEKRCLDQGIKMTEQRRVIARVFAEAKDHPDVEEVYRRASLLDDRISIATVYRTVRLFEEAGVLERHDFRDGRARYEKISDEGQHDHLIDVKTGKIIEFQSDEIDRIRKEIAEKMGFRLIGHTLALYGVPLASKESE
ncbi:transcriptional repressor [Phaeovibrio sulfidiphilus]|uniref:Ferric uptake regulation protein n=1 Tax=Phaeovibrio sulfidiphilus TaxID=1220600 RepID=A0A8J7CVW5_9PROT|nr:Fur family transcriptional regulator [Phaeovibrio sulfidiphilus]MBE1236796.1 transcriptional repressor [Phaeovibrio sulfidiphilus]